MQKNNNIEMDIGGLNSKRQIYSVMQNRMNPIDKMNVGTPSPRI